MEGWEGGSVDVVVPMIGHDILQMEAGDGVLWCCGIGWYWFGALEVNRYVLRGREENR